MTLSHKMICILQMGVQKVTNLRVTNNVYLFFGIVFKVGITYMITQKI
jgi:hypothetical protein